jgi:hypothetical protein
MKYPYWFVYASEGVVIETILQRDIDSISHPLPPTSVFLCSGSREVLPKFVKAASHYTICGVEGFLDTITVVTVDVNVQHSWVCSQELKDSEYNVIDVTKARRLPLLSMMKAARPID